MEALTRLKQNSIVAIYKVQFDTLSNRLKGLSERHKLSCFMSGLKDEIQFFVRMLNLINLNVVFGLAKIQEEHLWDSRKSWRGSVVCADKAQSEVVGESSRLQRGTPPIKRTFSSKIDEKWRKVSVIIMMRSGIQPMYVRIPRCTCYK